MPFCAATALVDGRLEFRSFQDGEVRNADVRALDAGASPWSSTRACPAGSTSTPGAASRSACATAASSARRRAAPRVIPTGPCRPRPCYDKFLGLCRPGHRRPGSRGGRRADRPSRGDSRPSRADRATRSGERRLMGVLDGIRILELARVPPAEMPGMMLADMGADVLKIETPEPERPRDPDADRRTAFAFVNRNKRSMTLNLKAPEGQAIFRRLADEADVVMEGFRPGVMARLGRRLRDAARAQSTPRLLLALGLRPGRPHQHLSGPRPQLHLAGRRAGPDR